MKDGRDGTCTDRLRHGILPIRTFNVKSRNVSVYIQEQTQHVLQTHTYMDNGQTSVRADSHTVAPLCPCAVLRHCRWFPQWASQIEPWHGHPAPHQQHSISVFGIAVIDRRQGLSKSADDRAQSHLVARLGGWCFGPDLKMGPDRTEVSTQDALPPHPTPTPLFLPLLTHEHSPSSSVLYFRNIFACSTFHPVLYIALCWRFAEFLRMTWSNKAEQTDTYSIECPEKPRV